jgi:hypothetical protein
VTTQENWANIFDNINPQENEVILARSLDHAISITRKNNQYVIYDPNYEEAEKSFATPSELVKELHGNCLQYDSKEMGLTISVITHPEQEPRATLPMASDIYNRYLNASNVGTKAIIESKQATTIELAAFFNDSLLIQKLLKLEKNKFNIYNAAIFLAINNNPDVLKQLLPLVDNTNNNFFTLLFNILKSGRQEVFNAFMQIPEARQNYHQLLNANNSAQHAINFAAEGGNA